MTQDPLILLVEDGEDDIELAQMALRESGYPHRLRIVRDGKEAVAYLHSDETFAEVPAVVLLDMNLPFLDGRTVLSELRGSPCTARVPVVILSSSRLEQDVLDAYTLGANSYVQKPLDFGAFRAGVSVLLTSWLRLNVPARAEGAVSERGPLPRVRTPSVGKDGAVQGAEIVVVDATAADRAATIGALREVVGTETIVGLSTFREVAQVLQQSGGPPPRLKPGTPRLLFVDPALPDGDGRDLLQAIRYRCDHHILIVVFARESEPAFVSECYRLKVNSVVCKPDDPEVYRETVRLLGHYWIVMNERPPRPESTLRPYATPG
ncbi:MAG: response regulator [Myxococcota bacterium]